MLGFELLAGHPPFTVSPAELLAQHLAKPAPPLAPLAPQAPGWFTDLAQACLAKDPARRPPDAGVLLDTLDGVRAVRSSWPRLVRHLAELERVRHGIVAAGVIGAWLGFPLAVAAGSFSSGPSRARWIARRGLRDPAGPRLTP